jgi:hypothetical protein
MAATQLGLKKRSNRREERAADPRRKHPGAAPAANGSIRSDFPQRQVAGAGEVEYHGATEFSALRGTHEIDDR